MPLSYKDTVLALGPIGYWRADDPIGSTVIVDSSGNGYNGTYDALAELGQASPIETDPASLAVRSAMGSVPAPNGHPLDIRGDLTWLYWVYYDPAFGNSGHVINRRGQWGQSNTVQTGINEDHIVATITLENGGSGDYFPLTATTSLTPNRWYFVVVTRNSNVLRIYVNGQLGLGNERTDLTAADIDYNVDGRDWFLGRSHNTTAFSSAGSDELAILDYPITAGDVLTVYEAALNRLLSSATIQVRVQVVLDTDAPELINFPFAHNWTEPISGSERVITEHLSWRTHANQSEPDYQQRVNARPHGPRRSLEYAITPTSALARAAFQRTLWQPAQVFKLPVWTDWESLTATANVSDTTLDCDTTLRDFEVGSYCTIATDPYNPATFQFFKITSRTGLQLGILPSVTTAVTNGFIAPARLACLPADESQLESYVIDRETGALTFEILDTELSSRRATAYVPASTYQPNLTKPAIEVFSLDAARFDILEQAPYAIRQRQLGTDNLTGNDYYRGVDTATSSTMPVRVLLVSRETLAEFYGWLNARQGRQNPVWVPSKENDLTFIRAVSGTVLRIEAGYAFYNLHYGRRDVQVTFADGTVANRRITAVVENGDGTENITLNSSVSASITKLSWLRFCVAPDSFELRFHRDLTLPGNMIVECAWEFTELLTTP